MVDANRIVLTPTQAGLDGRDQQGDGRRHRGRRKRIDALGTREPTIVREGARPDPRPGARPAGSGGAQGADRPAPPSSNSSWSISTSPRRSVAGGPRADRQPDPALWRRRPARRIAVQRRAIITGDSARPTPSRPTTRMTSARPSDQVRQRRRPPLRPGDAGQCRQAVRDHPRQCRALGAEHQRADPRRHGADPRQFHRRKRQCSSPSRCGRARCR